MSWCPYRELGLAPGASPDDVKRAFKLAAIAYHPDKHVNSSEHERASAAQRFRAIKEAYDTLTDDRRRAAYAASSSSYQRGGGRAAGRGAASWAAGGAGVNTDWTRRGGDPAAPGVSRLSRWQWWQRWARQEARAFDRTLHGGLAILTLGGLLLFDVGGDLLWASRNRGRSFDELQRQRQLERQEQEQGQGQQQGRQEQQQQKQEPDSAPAGGSKRRPGAWLDSMRGRAIDAQDAGDDGGAAAAAASARPFLARKAAAAAAAAAAADAG